VDGEVSVVVEIPPGFGRALRTGRPTEVMAVVDGAMPFRAETAAGYVAGLHEGFLSRLAAERAGAAAPLARIEPRFVYNQGFESIAAMAPALPSLLLILLPAILTAVGIARERELGTIVNFRATPTRRIEFLVGKQAPYVAIAFANFVVLTATITLVFGVPLEGSLSALVAGAALYAWAATSFGLLVSTAVSSQVTAVIGTAIVAIIPTVQFSGLLQPVSTLEGGARAFGSLWPASYFLHLSVGAFTKGLGWEGLWRDVVALAAFGPAFTALAALGLAKQAR
jgi:ribosome-dependent ATPase